MRDRLPPLTALRAFEAAARHMSFAMAADELHVTPAALSYQIKSLEEHLGQPLFLRLNRAVALTEAGCALAPGTSDGFNRLNAAWRTAQRLTDDKTLTVTAGPAFTSKWLAPRLYDFAMANPEIDLRLSAGFRMMDFSRDDIDVAIRFSYDTSPELYSLPLGNEWFVPVMSPTLAERFRTAESLTRAPLLYEASTGFLNPACDWPAWFRANGLDFAPDHGARFSQADHAVDAALSGAGVLLGWHAVVARDLKEGRLVAPVPIALQTRAQFHFLCQKGTQNRPQIAAFRHWVQSEIDKTSHISDTLTIIPIEDVAE